MWVSSFVELFCGYFDDLGLDNGFDPLIRDGVISQEEVDLSSAFHHLVDKYEDGEMSTEEILADPSWHTVVAEAGSLWNDLSQLSLDPVDRALMESLEERFGSP